MARRSRISRRSETDRCPTSGKRRFRDHREAVSVLHQSAIRRKRAEERQQQTRRREIHSYRCKDCHGWHLTSQPTRPKRGRRKKRGR